MRPARQFDDRRGYIGVVGSPGKGGLWLLLSRRWARSRGGRSWGELWSAGACSRFRKLKHGLSTPKGVPARPGVETKETTPEVAVPSWHGHPAHAPSQATPKAWCHCRMLL